MPNRDKTGPCGKGPLTGRKLGSCNKKKVVEKEVSEIGEQLAKLEKKRDAINYSIRELKRKCK